jgi:hypothetical protein
MLAVLVTILALIGSLYSFHLTLIVRNLTTNESVKAIYKNLPNPFDRAVILNIVNRFKPWSGYPTRRIKSTKVMPI